MLRTLHLVGTLILLALPASATSVRFSDTYYGKYETYGGVPGGPSVLGYGELSVSFEGTDVDGDGFITGSSTDIITSASMSGTIYNGGIYCDIFTSPQKCTLYDIYVSIVPSGVRVKTDLSVINLVATNGPETLGLNVSAGKVSGSLDILFDYRYQLTRSTIVNSYTPPVPLPASGLLMLAVLLLLPARRIFFRARRFV